MRDVYVGGAGKLMSTLGKNAPRAMDYMGEKMLMPQQRRNEPPRDRAGALHSAGRDGRVRGDHPGYVMHTSAYTRASLHPVLTTTMLALAGLAAASIMGGTGKRRPRRPNAEERERAARFVS